MASVAGGTGVIKTGGVAGDLPGASWVLSRKSSHKPNTFMVEKSLGDSLVKCSI